MLPVCRITAAMCAILLGLITAAHAQSPAKKKPAPVTEETCNEIAQVQNIVRRDYDLAFTEMTHIRGGDKQFPDIEWIGKPYFDHFVATQSVTGERRSVQYYSPNISRPAPKGLPISGGQKMTYYLSYGEKESLMDQYLAILYPEMSQSSKNLVKSTLINNEESLKSAYLAVEKAKIPPGLVLSNYGRDRYFSFIPHGESHAVNARILDVHPTSRGKEYGILAEYISSEISVGQRVRRVVHLTQAEVLTITRGSPYEIELEFIDTLTPLQYETKLFAESLNIPLFGYSTYRGMEDINSMYMMNNITWMAIQAHVEQRMPWVTEAYLDFERGTTPNPIDVFARLDPRYVLNRFYDPAFQYMWVITEDYTLKVSPKMMKGNNLRSQILRLAGGRKIVAGGDFHFDADGYITLQYETNNYQDMSRRWSPNQDAFSSASSPYLEQFVRMVWNTQTQHRVRSVQSAYEASLGRMDENTRKLFEEHFGTGSNRGYVEDEEFEKIFRERTSTLFNQTHRQAENLKWTDETGPLSYENWLLASKAGQENSTTKKVWGLYVLRMEPDSKIEEIKKSYRKLAMQFHPDHNAGKNMVEILKIFNAAWELFDPKVQNKN